MNRTSAADINIQAVSPCQSWAPVCHPEQKPLRCNKKTPAGRDDVLCSFIMFLLLRKFAKNKALSARAEWRALSNSNRDFIVLVGTTVYPVEECAKAPRN